MRTIIAVVLAGLALCLAGCAANPQKPVTLQSSSIASKTTRVGVAMTEVPKPEMQMPGAGCLLCIAAAQIANSSLSDYSKTLPLEDLPQLKDEVAKRINAKGGNAIVIPEPIDLSKLGDFNSDAPNAARKDFRPLREKYRVDKLVVLSITAVGMQRTYSAYIPTSDPKAALIGTGYLVDLATNTYEWYQPVSVLKASDKSWDEPPKFPGLTNAYFQAVELGKDAFTKPFE